MRQTTLILLECRARSGQAGPRAPLLWRHYAGEIAEALSPLELVQVADVEEAETAAWDAAVLGFNRIVAVGGPQAAHGLINGVMRLTEGHRRRMKIGFLSLGQRGAWARSAGLPTALARQLEILAAGNTLPYDIGKVECSNSAGAPVVRYFLLGSACGPMGASWADARSAPLRVAHVAAGLMRAAGRSLIGTMPEISLRVDQREVYRGPWAMTMIMGGSHYPWLGQIARDANPSDGSLDVVWIPAPDPIRMAGHAAALWINGQWKMPEDFLHPPRCRGTEVRIEPVGRDAADHAIEADGVAIGILPATIRVVPRTFPVIVEAVAARMRERTRAAAEMPATALAGGLGRVSMRRGGWGRSFLWRARRRVRVRRLQPWASASR